MANRVLIVDDDEIVRAVHERDLQRWGYVVASAADAAEAVSMARAFRPDLILMDRMLPDADGVALAARMARELADHPPRVLVVSGSYDEERSGDGSVVRYLPKGIDRQRLRRLVAAALAGERLSCIPPVSPAGGAGRG
ncbi:MAG: response regulator [Myxococcota bacterium]